MSMRTYDEMIASLENMGETLVHFNPNHDPRNGQFAKDSIGDRIEKRHLEKIIERADRKMQRKQRKLDKIEIKGRKLEEFT